MSNLRWISLILVVVGALNWGLVGLFQFNLVNTILGAVPVLERIVYILIGLAGVVLAIAPETWRRPVAMA